jgi:hypothetical protein
MLNNATLAAILLICAGIIHNYSFMCRKLKASELKVFYPQTASGKLLFDFSWMLIAAAGLFLTYGLSVVLAALAAAIYFLLLPFVLQPPLARLLGFKCLAAYVEHIDQQQEPPQR